MQHLRSPSFFAGTRSVGLKSYASYPHASYSRPVYVSYIGGVRPFLPTKIRCTFNAPFGPRIAITIT